MLKEANFSPSSCAKSWMFVKTPHYCTSIRRALLLLALIVCKNRMHPFILLGEVTSEGTRGRRLFDLKDECLMDMAFANVFNGVENWKKNSPIIHTVLMKTIVLFLDILEFFFFFFGICL